MTQGLTAHNNKRNGFRVIRLHYTADPDRDAAWVERTRKLYSEAAWDQEYELKRTASSLLVWPSYRPDVHVVDALPLRPPLTLTVGLDPGWDHPFAAVFVLTDDDGRACIVDEHVKPRLLISEHVDILINKARKALGLSDGVPDRAVARSARWIIDPSQAQIIHELAAFGINAYKQPAGRRIKINDVGAGVNRVGEWFADRDPWGPRLTLVRGSTQWLRWELQQYQWERGPGGMPLKDKVRKLNDDACDALRYALMSRPRPAVDRSKNIWPSEAPAGERIEPWSPPTVGDQLRSMKRSNRMAAVRSKRMPFS